MDRRFNDLDRDKRVLTSDGQQIGTVRDVDGDRVTVERSDDDSLAEELKEMLGWGDDDDTFELHRNHVSRTDDDDIYLDSGR